MSVNTYAEIKEKNADIANLINNLILNIKKLKNIGVQADEEALRELMKYLENESFKVLVLGEFKNGKSTFINSLLGEEILPSHSKPCTAVISEVTYGKKPRATLHFKNPAPEKLPSSLYPRVEQHIKKYKGSGEIPPLEIPDNELFDYITICDDPICENDDEEITLGTEFPYSKVVLEYPIDLCRDGVEIIDSPGLSESEIRTRVTEEYINQADAIVLLLRCPNIIRASEEEYIENMLKPRGFRNIFFVCNAINQIEKNEQEEAIRKWTDMLSPYTELGKNGVFYVNAKGALKAKRDGDLTYLNRTGIPEFEASLSDYLCKNKGREKLLRLISQFNCYVDKIESESIDGYLKALDLDADDLDRRVKEAMPKLETAKQNKLSAEKKIENFLNEQKAIIIKDMNKQNEEIIKNICGFVKTMELDTKTRINPFKRKENKESIQREVAEKISEYIDREMNNWVKESLNPKLEDRLNEFEKQVGADFDKFYGNIDKFRYDLSGVEQPKEASGFKRAAAGFFGTLLCSPTYGIFNSDIKLSDAAKMSGFNLFRILGLAAGGVATFIFTPLTLPAVAGIVGAAAVGTESIQIIQGKKGLTNKYKDEVAKGIKKYLEDEKEKMSSEYAENVVQNMKKHLIGIIKPLDNEIAEAEELIVSLKKDKQIGNEEIEEKRMELNNIRSELENIKKELRKTYNEIA